MAIRPPDPHSRDGVVTLRPWGEPGDVEAITAACNDRAIAEFLDMIPSPYTENDARAYLEHCRIGWADGTTDELRDRRRQAGAVGSIGVRWLDGRTGRRRGRLLGGARSSRSRRLHARAATRLALGARRGRRERVSSCARTSRTSPSNKVAAERRFHAGRRAALESLQRAARPSRRLRHVLAAAGRALAGHTRARAARRLALPATRGTGRRLA